MPHVLRDHTGSLESFKAMLDFFLEGVPDQPNHHGANIPRVEDYFGNPINSVCHWISKLNLQSWFPAGTELSLQLSEPAN